MAIRSAKDIRDQLRETCCKCKQVRDAVSVQRVLRDAVEGGEGRAPAQIQPSSSFTALPNPRQNSAR